MVRLFGIGKQRIKAGTMVGLTEIGKRTAERFTSMGRRFVILSKLSERPMTVSELSEETGMDMPEVEELVENMISSNYIRVMGGETE